MAIMSRKALIDTFFSLVTVDSPTGKEEQFADFLIDQLAHLGLSVLKDKYGNVYARLEGEGEAIFFSAHMDTVEPGQGIVPQVKGEYLVSDGTTILGADDKVGIAALLEAIKKICTMHHRPIELIFTRSEEIGNYGAIEFDYSLLSAEKGYCLDLSQPVGTITTASPFYERFDIRLGGKSAHASHPEEAINVLPALAEIICIAPLGKEDDTFFNIGVVSGGDVRNTILGEVLLKGEIRSFVGKELKETKALFRKNVEKICHRYMITVQEEWIWENPGYKHTSNKAQEFIQTTQKAVRQVGLRPVITQTAGVSDANIFNDKGLLCLNLGDGSEFAHTLQERVKITELENLVKLIAALATS